MQLLVLSQRKSKEPGQQIPINTLAVPWCASIFQLYTFIKNARNSQRVDIWGKTHLTLRRRLAAISAVTRPQRGWCNKGGLDRKITNCGLLACLIGTAICSVQDLQTLTPSFHGLHQTLPTVEA